MPLLKTDVILPGINDRTQAAAIAALNPPSKILFTSGYVEDVMVHHGVLEYGIQSIDQPFKRPYPEAQDP